MYFCNKSFLCAQIVCKIYTYFVGNQPNYEEKSEDVKVTTNRLESNLDLHIKLEEGLPEFGSKNSKDDNTSQLHIPLLVSVLLLKIKFRLKLLSFYIGS